MAHNHDVFHPKMLIQFSVARAVIVTAHKRGYSVARIIELAVLLFFWSIRNELLATTVWSQ
jgi:hypothetical protein